MRHITTLVHIFYGNVLRVSIFKNELKMRHVRDSKHDPSHTMIINQNMTELLHSI